MVSAPPGIGLIAVAVGAGSWPEPFPDQLAGLDVRRLELSRAGPAGWAAVLAEVLDQDPAGVKVCWVVSAEAVEAVWRQARVRADTLALTTESALKAAVAALGRGASLASLVYPPAPTPRRAVESAGLAPRDSAGRCDVRLDESADGPWLRFTDTGVQVRALELTPLERAAVAERAADGRFGPPRPTGGHLVIGRSNYANQGRAWAQAVNDHVPGFTAANFQVKDGGGWFGFDADHLVLGPDFADPVRRVDIALEFGAPATHVLIEEYLPLFQAAAAEPGGDVFGDARREVEQLLESGRSAAVLIHGTSGRDPFAHASIYPWSPYRDPVPAKLERAGQLAVERLGALEAVREIGLELFVATLDMVDYLPDAHWLPIVPGPGAFAPAPAWEPGERLRVAHIPSADVMKGSGAVDRSLSRLAAAGLIDYLSLRSVPSTRMPAVLRGVDVVVDQVVLGNPATLLIETMAAGRLAVAHVANHVRRRFPEPLPVVEADGAEVSEVIADVAADPERYRAVAEAGPAFARRYHDGRLSAQVLERHFLSPGGPK
ncbi:MAG: hypothetical protein LBO20_08715 [Bifidobacteriaceae bacterium]|jgi:hypothetical protein|nr:hypothetical protein [Bifidobacteriaceae bacterium]